MTRRYFCDYFFAESSRYSAGRQLELAVGDDAVWITHAVVERDYADDRLGQENGREKNGG